MPGSNWSNTTMVPQPGSTVNGGGGGGIPKPIFRDQLDAQRSMAGNLAPGSSYPDGYLGTIQPRRGDKLLDVLKKRQNSRSYTRGVHKGERIDMGDYFWPPEVNPTMGLQLEAKGQKYAPRLDLAESENGYSARPAGEGRARAAFFNPGSGDPSTPSPRGPQNPSQMLDPRRQARLSAMGPSWK